MVHSGGSTSDNAARAAHGLIAQAEALPFRLRRQCEAMLDALAWHDEQATLDRIADDAIAAAADLAVLSLPNGLASTLVPPLLERGVKVVDLSADYRYSSLDHWNEVYASEARSFPRSEKSALLYPAPFFLREVGPLDTLAPVKCTPCLTGRRCAVRRE